MWPFFSPSAHSNHCTTDKRMARTPTPTPQPSPRAQLSRLLSTERASRPVLLPPNEHQHTPHPPPRQRVTGGSPREERIRASIVGRRSIDAEAAGTGLRRSRRLPDTGPLIPRHVTPGCTRTSLMALDEALVPPPCFLRHIALLQRGNSSFNHPHSVP